MLVANLDDIRVTNRMMIPYHKVYAIGRKRKEKFNNGDEVLRIMELMEEGSSLERLPNLDEPLYKVLPGSITPKYFPLEPHGRRPGERCFASVCFDPSWDGVDDAKKPASPQLLLPDKEMHRVLRMASGRLNGKVGRGSALHVLKGIVKKEISQTVAETPSDTVITDTEVFKITFKLVDRFGNIRTIQG